MNRTAVEEPPAALLTPARAKRRRPQSRRIPFWLMAPSLVLLTLITYLPLVLAVIISTTALSQYTISNFWHAPVVLLKNYVDALNPSGALSVLGPLRNSVGFSVLTTLFTMPLGVGAALLVNQRFRGRALVRTVMLLPFIMPAFVTALLWRLLFQTGTGPIDRILGATHLGSAGTFWLIGPNSFWALVIADTWASWPFVYMMVLAALQSIPKEHYDAAAVDGAGVLRRFSAVTLPAIKPTLVLALCLSTINHFNNFTLPFILLGQTPPAQASLLPIEIYTASFTSFDFGHAAAIAIVNLLILLIPTAYYLRRARAEEV
jgi:multiple sugar transport system permease protein